MRIDLVIESLNVAGHGRADIPVLEPDCLVLQIEEPTRSREYRAPTPTDRAAAQGARARAYHKRRSPVLRATIPLVPVGFGRHGDHPARDTRALAPCWLSVLLAL